MKEGDLQASKYLGERALVKDGGQKTSKLLSKKCTVYFGQRCISQSNVFHF